MIVSKWFQVLFHSAHRGSFHLSLTVLVRYRSSSSIQGWIVVDPASNRISRVPSYSGYCQVKIGFHIRGYHPLCLNFPVYSINRFQSTLQSYNPTSKLVVCPLTLSLAATSVISVDFFSLGYLDVSVPLVSSIW